MATPMFIVTGFLDSGKTTMIKDTLMECQRVGQGDTFFLADNSKDHRIVE